jgi:tetratricopeptide (TPR) repeat protein
MKFVQATFLYVVYSVTAMAATPSPEELARAVKNLGADEFPVREEATRFLWEAGTEAQAMLEKVRDDPDPEVSQRARQLLQYLQFGIRPDMPDKIRDLITRYREAKEDNRHAIIEDLVKAGPVAYPALVALGRMEPDAEKRMAAFWPLIELTFEKAQAAVTLAEPSPDLLKEAVALSLVCIKIFPEDISPVVGLVIRMADRGLEAQARELFAQVIAHFEGYLAKNPNDEEALNNLAWLCALTRQDLAKATERSRKAVELSPKSAAYLDTLAELQFIQGHQKEALELMKQCLKLEPDSPYFQAQLKRFEANDTKSRPPVNLAGE